MCTDVLVNGKLAHTKAELRELAGVEPVMDANCTSDDWPDECCLCPCDLDATAKAAGMQLKYVEWYWVMTANV